MPRNLDRRVETLFPIQDSAGAEQVKAALGIYFSDNVKARRMSQDGSYSRVAREDGAVNSQAWLLEQAKAVKKAR
jgi:polyphosphate kinase